MHDVIMVYKIIDVVSNYIKINLPQIKNIQYFSNKYAGQYKNCKNILNLCFHLEDFGLSAKWNFATSLSKQPCDGIGGKVKCLATQASFQRDMGNHILSPQAMYKYCNGNIEGTKLCSVDENVEFIHDFGNIHETTANLVLGDYVCVSYEQKC
ncbi:uncharacterized protein LOC124807906 [Hydra vulgaris]|uniref:uncharacterized protein LOC124807906 n=1 Tax=Hydra vulgaris TaxID=6087 RepID=UPI001F5FAC8C|nr:uncharacterized protein LOC124807906 [Hydra vulgaris]